MAEKQVSMDMGTEIEKLAEEFESCRKVLIALGDENRQHLILEMMRMGNCSGVRVDPDTKGFDRLVSMLQKAKELTGKLPDRSIKKRCSCSPCLGIEKRRSCKVFLYSVFQCCVLVYGLAGFRAYQGSFP